MPYPVFPTHLFAFDEQDIDIESRTISGGTSLSGVEDKIATDGGGHVYAEFSNGPLLERGKTLAWRSYLGQLDGGVTPVIVPFCDPEHQPVVEGEAEPVATVQFNAALRATTLHLQIDLPTPLVGGEWLSIDHPGAGLRAYKVGRVVGQSAGNATVEISPPLREKTWAGESVDFADPRCLMVQQGPASSLINLGKYGEASIRFVEAPFAWSPAALFRSGDQGYWFDFSRQASLSTSATLGGDAPDLDGSVGFARDLSGKGNPAGQTQLSRRPLWKEAPSGLRGLWFDGVNDIFYLSRSVFTTAGCTVVACVQVDALNQSAAQVIWGEVGETTEALYNLCTGAGRTLNQDTDQNAKLRIVLKNDAGTVTTLDTKEAFADDNPRVITLRDNAATMGSFIDNRKEASTLARTGTFSINNYAIGALDGVGAGANNSHMTGWIFGLFAIDRPLSDSELLQLQQWMAQRYYVPMRHADGVHTTPVVPRVTMFHGHRLIGSLTKSAGVRVTDMEWGGDFRGRAYSPFSMGAVAGDAHSAPALLAMSDGRLLAGWTGHNKEFWVRVTTGESIAAGQWGQTRNIVGSTNELGLANQCTYASFQEMATGVYTFIRSRLSSETNAQRGYWYSSAVDPGVISSFATATKFISGTGDQGPYVVGFATSPYRRDFQISTGNPGSTAANSIYHCYMAISPTTGAVTFHQSDGTPITIPMAPSDASLVYNGTTNRGWIGDIVMGADGHPRMTFVVFNDVGTEGDYTYHYGRWTGSAWVTAPIANGGAVTIPGNFIANGGCAIDPEDTNVVVASCLPTGGDKLEAFRLTSADNGATWDAGERLTDDEQQIWAPSFIRGAPEPRLVLHAGPFVDDGGVFVGDTRLRMTNSVTGEYE